MKKMLALALALIMLVGAFAACGEKKVKVNGNFRTYWANTAATSFNFWNTDTSVGDLWGLQCARMYNDKATKDGESWEWTLELASDWPKQVDSEGKVWDIPLKKDLKWANGEPLTAHDIEYSYKMWVDPVSLPTNANNITNSAQISVVKIADYYEGKCSWDEVGMKAIDDNTFRLTLNTPAPQTSVRSAMSGNPLVYEPLYEACFSEDRTINTYGTSVDKIMSSGAFSLIEWIPDAKFVLERNPNFVRADEIHLQYMTFNVIPDAQTAIELFQTGELDYVKLNYTDWENFEDDPRVFEWFNDSLMYMMINLGNPNFNNILGNLNFRNALYYGIDRNKIAQAIDVYPATRFVRKSVVGDNRDMRAFVDFPQDYVLTAEESYNPTLANEYLTKAFEETNNKEVTEDIMLSETATHIRAVTEILQKDYPTVFNNKVKVNIRSLPSAQTQSLRRWHEDDPTSFDIALGSVLPSATDCRLTFRYYISSYDPPRTNWKDAEYDAIYESCSKLDLQTQAEEIVAACQKMEKILLDNKIIVPVYERPEKCLYADNVHLPVKNYVIGFGFGNKYMSMD